MEQSAALQKDAAATLRKIRSANQEKGGNKKKKKTSKKCMIRNKIAKTGQNLHTLCTSFKQYTTTSAGGADLYQLWPSTKDLWLLPAAWVARPKASRQQQTPNKRCITSQRLKRGSTIKSCNPINTFRTFHLA